MISESKFSEIIIKHMAALMEEVKENGLASGYQWTDQLSNMVVSTLMTLTDNMNVPRKEAMAHLTADLISKILKQADFQVKYDGVSIEDVKKDFKNVK